MQEKLDILVTVKAYPNISQRHGEVVCVAGIRTDTSSNGWVRLFPIQFRDLEFSKQFQKYQVIHLRAKRHSGDPRPESYRPDTDSMEVGSKVGTSQAWRERRSLVEPLMLSSMCELLRRQKVDGTSLGVFRPAEVIEFTVEEGSESWDPSKQAVINQPSLLLPTKTGLEKIPYTFRYRYRCSDASCPSHHQSIIDWELAQAYRKWRKEYGAAEVLDRLKARWLDEMCGDSKDTAFFAGNMHQHQESFLVLGVFWPPKL